MLENEKTYREASGESHLSTKRRIGKMTGGLNAKRSLNER